MAPRNEPQGPPPQRPPTTRLLSRLSHVSKRSLRSYSSSFEADDERSSSGSSRDPRMSPRNSSSLEGRRAAPAGRYPGEDTRSTSPKELAGWFSYAFAAEVYMICGSFIPILLESLARENGVLLSDRTKPCGSSSDKKPKDSSGSGQCIIYVLGVEVNTASFTMYTFSISVLLQALLVVSISCAADHGNYRKRLLLAFGWIGSIAVMLYLAVSKEIYLLGAFLAIVSNTSFGASFVLLNSFLPLLVRHHPAIEKNIVASLDETRDWPEGQRLPPTDVDASEGESVLRDTQEPGTPLLAGSEVSNDHLIPRLKTHQELISLELQISTQISAKGIGIGYMAGLFLQCLLIVILVKMGSSTWSLRVVLFVVGCWWAIFTVPAAMWLRPRPGPPLPAATNSKGMWGWVAYLAFAWKSLFRTMTLATRLIDIVLFLAAWFLLSDAIATTSSTAILFAKTHLHMQSWALAMINVISTTFGVVGAFSWSWLSTKFGLRPNESILMCIALFECIPLYGLLGYLPFVRSWGVLGLQQPWEMYPLAAVYGFILGGFGGYCRSLYGELIPPGSEAAFYALYAITDKGSSVFGPAIVGAIIDASGEIRPAFWFLAALVGAPAPFIWFVNAERGKAEGEKLAGVIEGFKGAAGSNNRTGPEEYLEDEFMFAHYEAEQDGIRARS